MLQIIGCDEPTSEPFFLVKLPLGIQFLFVALIKVTLKYLAVIKCYILYVKIFSLIFSMSSFQLKFQAHYHSWELLFYPPSSYAVDSIYSRLLNYFDIIHTLNLLLQNMFCLHVKY
jgi:hypothetical protein